MAEYIEREALILENLEKYMTVMEVNTSEYGNQTVVAVDDLMYLPIADVAEVKHSDWEVNECADVWICKLCRRWLVVKQQTADMNFCPNCGARMDADDNDR